MKKKTDIDESFPMEIPKHLVRQVDLLIKQKPLNRQGSMKNADREEVKEVMVANSFDKEAVAAEYECSSRSVDRALSRARYPQQAQWIPIHEGIDNL